MQDCLSLFLPSQSLYMLSNSVFCIPAVSVNPSKILFIYLCLYNCNHSQSTRFPMQDSFPEYLQSQTVNMLSKARFFFFISAITVNQHFIPDRIPYRYICSLSKLTYFPRQDSLILELQPQSIYGTCCPKQDSFSEYLQSQIMITLSKAGFFSVCLQSV